MTKRGAATPRPVSRVIYFFVWDSALPATLFEALLYRPSVKILEALDATDLLVCFLFAKISPPHNFMAILYHI